MVMLLICHVGAGVIKLDLEYKRVIRDALKQGIQKDSIEEALLTVMTLLENSKLTNAGVSGNLNLNGEIRVDASVMNGDGSFGSIGNVPGFIKSSSSSNEKDQYEIIQPTLLAFTLMKNESLGPCILGRVPPLLITGQDAFKFAQKHSLTTFSQSNPITDSSQKRFRKHSSWLLEDSHTQKRTKYDHTEKAHINDTIGVIAVGENGRVISAVSSCGMSLKEPGRVGEAGIYGAGVWAQDYNPSDGISSLGISISGQGEQIIRTGLARCAYQRLLPLDADAPSQVQNLIEKDFLSSPLLSRINDQDKDVGFILYTRNESGHQLYYAHSTPDFGLGWITSKEKKPHALVSRLPKNAPFLVSSHSFST